MRFDANLSAATATHHARRRLCTALYVEIRKIDKRHPQPATHFFLPSFDTRIFVLDEGAPLASTSLMSATPSEAISRGSSRCRWEQPQLLSTSTTHPNAHHHHEVQYPRSYGCCLGLGCQRLYRSPGDPALCASGACTQLDWFDCSIASFAGWLVRRIC